MKRIIILSAFLLALFPSVSLYGAIIDKIAVVVNDEIITDGEIEKAIAPLYEQYRAIYRGSELLAKLEEAKQKVVEQLVEERLILSQAKKLNIEVDEQDIDKKVAETQNRFGSKEEFEKALAAQRLSLKDLRSRYREQLMSRGLVDEKVGSKITITPVEASNYYNAHKEEFVLPEEIKLDNILVSPAGSLGPQKAAELAKEIARRLKEGGDFAGLAKVYSEGPGASDGGSMGYVKRGELMPEIEKVVFNMKEGEVSDMIQTHLGYHFFKVEEKMASRARPYTEAQAEVEEAVFREKIKDKLKGWIEGLKKNAYIAFK
jgi:peptidyl-prolyl cis-trans isomerase SurA